MLVYVILFQHELVRYHITSIFSYGTLIAVRNNLHRSAWTILHISKRICNLSSNFV